MPVPSYEHLLPIVLELAKTEQRMKTAVEAISDQLKLTDEERTETIPSGPTPLIYSRVAWAVTYMVQAGLLERPKRGHFEITEYGRSVLMNDRDKLNLAYLKKIPEFIDFTNRKSGGESSAPQSELSGTLSGEKSPEEIIGLAYTELEADLKEQVLDRILKNSPAFFEDLVVRLLSKLGYGRHDTLSKVQGKVGDGGIDGIIHQDKLGLDVVYIQAKRYTDTAVSRPELQAFVGTLAGVSAHKGVFVTTSRFSPGALEYLKTVGARVITIDGPKLVDLMVESGVGVRTRQVFELHRIDEDFFLEE